MSERAPLPELLLAPPRGRVLAIAPHPDDEVLGCGGTLALHAAQQDEVRVIVVFDGRAGLPAGTDPALRRGEALAGGAHLGLATFEFWDLPEGHEPSASELAAGVARLAAAIEACAPRTLYAPWIGEHHLDHHVASRAASAAVRASGFDGDAWGYEVWTPLVPARIVDVTPVWARKLAALAEHRSQLERSDLARASSGLAAHRGLFLAGRERMGEAFARLADPESSA